MTARISMPAGTKFGRWTVVGSAETVNGKAFCACRCECGATKNVPAYVLRNKESQSCGCLRTEERAQRATKHGMTNTPTYRSWVGMLTRCKNPKNRLWEYYGARGISVCGRWREFSNFVEDMGIRPPNLTLDRINNDGNYEPGNCRWATSKQQAANRRKRRWHRKPNGESNGQHTN